MARKICTAGVVGSISFMILDGDGSAVSFVRADEDEEEIITRHTDIDVASEWTERKVRELIGKRYEDN